jgi:hypothetical protein
MVTETERRQASKRWAQRNSDQVTTLAPLPGRVLMEEPRPVIDPPGIRGQEILWQRHLHLWAVDDPSATVGTFGAPDDLPSLFHVGDGDGSDGDGDGHALLADTALAPFTTVEGDGDGDGDGHATRSPRELIAGDD